MQRAQPYSPESQEQGEPEMSKRWYCFQLYPQQRHIAERELTRQDFTTFFGQITTGQPLFKGYGFVYLDLTEDHNWPKIRHTRGVIRLLPQHQSTPIPIPEGFVEGLIKKNPISRRDLIPTLEELTKDQIVTITEGPFIHQKAIVLHSYNETVAISFLFHHLQATIYSPRYALKATG